MEILGFVALIAIIFGISMTAAVGIIVKVILWIIGICVAIAIVGKMQASTAKTFAWIAVIAGGCLLAGLDSFQNTTYAPCFTIADVNLYGIESYENCMYTATEVVESRTSASIWLIVIGVVLFIAAWAKNDGSNNTNNMGQKTSSIKTKSEANRPERAQTKKIVYEQHQVKAQIADLVKTVPSLKKRVHIGSWITGISFIIGPVMYLIVLFFLPDEIREIIMINSVVYNILMIVAVINIIIFSLFLSLTPYWIIKYKGAKKDLEKLKRIQKENRNI